MRTARVISRTTETLSAAKVKFFSFARSQLDHSTPTDDSDQGFKLTNRFRLIALAIVFSSTAYLMHLINAGVVGASYQGDEGARIFDAYQVAFNYSGSLYGDLWQTFATTFFGFHPPGDTFIRVLSVKLISTLGFSPQPVKAMFTLSLLLGAISHLCVGILAMRAAGLKAAILAMLLFLSSFVILDIRLSAMGEATSLPFLLLSFVFLQQALLSEQRRFFFLAIGAVLFLLSSMIRPESSFLLPGLCLALWALVGFWNATAFGAIAASFEFTKILKSFLATSDGGLNLFNVGSAYFNGTHTFSSLIQTDFFQQFSADPAALIVFLGLMATITFLVVGRSRQTFAWQTSIILLSAAFSYLFVVIASQLTGLAPHASYRLAITSTHLLIPAYAIATIGVWNWTFLKLADHVSVETLRSTGLTFLVLVCGWSTFHFLTEQPERLSARTPTGLNKTAEFILNRTSASDAVYFDRMRYWENALIAYVANRPSPICIYSRCQVAMDETLEVWQTIQTKPAVAGTTSWGEFNTLRMHTFIRTFRPKFITIANEDVFASWMVQARRVFRDEAELWASHIYPYLLEEVNFVRPQENFLRLGKINGVEYYEEYVLLIPRTWNNLNIVFEAHYGRTPSDHPD